MSDTPEEKSSNTHASEQTSVDKPEPVKPKRRLAKRILWIVLSVIALILVAVLLVIGWVAGTASGTRFALNQARGFIPGSLEIENLQGALIGPLTFDKLHLQLKGAEEGQDTDVTVDQFVFDWHPSALFAGTLALDKLTANSVQVKLPVTSATPEPEVASEPFAMPDSLPIPINIEIGDIAVNQVAIEQGDFKQAITDIALQANTADGALKLTKLTATAPQGHALLTGSMELAQPYALTLNTDWGVTLPDMPALNGQGALTGDLDKLTLKQTLSGLAQSVINASVTTPLLFDKAAWQANINLQGANWKALVPSMAQLGLQAQLNASGSFSAAKIDLNADVKEPQLGRYKLAAKADADMSAAHIQQLEVTEQGGPAHILLSGNVDDLSGAQTLNLKGDWSNLHYPLVVATNTAAQTTAKSAAAKTNATNTASAKSESAKADKASETSEIAQPKAMSLAQADYQVTKGSISLTGTLNDYLLKLDSNISGKAIPKTQLALEGKGDLNQFSSLKLNAGLLGGSVDLNGKAGWAPSPAWDLTLTAKQIRPQTFWPDWKGSVGAEITTNGSLKDQLAAVVKIAALNGQLRNHPLSGQGTVNLSGSNVDIDKLNLGWGSAKVAADGHVGDQLAVDWSLQASDLRTLLPGAGGSLSGSGKVSGTQTKPVIAAKLNANQLRFQGNRVQKLDANLFADLGWAKPADIRIQATDLDVAGQSLSDLNLTAKGPAQRVNFAFDTKGDPGFVKLEGYTAVNTDPANWSAKGALTALKLINPQAGPWELDKSVPFNLSDQNYQVSAFCLKQPRNSGHICSDVAIKQGKGNAKVDIATLPLSMLSHWLPPTTKIDGKMNANANVKLLGAGKVSYDADMRIDGGRMSMAENDLTLTFDGTHLQAQGTQNQLKSSLIIPLPELKGDAKADFDIRDMSGAGRLNGQVTLNAQTLQALSVLAPDVQLHSGSADADIRIQGNFAKPKINGRFNLANGNIEIPMAGITLQDLNLEVKDDPSTTDQFLIAGQVTSGKGKLNIEGDANPIAPRANLTIKGDNFTAMGTKDISVQISPDLKIAYAATGVDVTGKVVVPSANISPPDLGKSAKTKSGDIVIVQTDDSGNAIPASPFNTNVQVQLVLGDHVNVDAFGFKGRLVGDLHIAQEGVGVARGTGTVGVAAGAYRLYGADLNIERGNVVFTGGPVSNPGLDLRVMRHFEEDDVDVGALISGSLRQPKMKLTSTPSMADNSILSYLVLGRSPDGASSSEQNMLMKLALSLGASGGNSITSKVKDSLNVDDLGFSSGDTMEESSFYVGKYLSPNLYLKYGIGLVEPVSTFLLRYKLSKRWALESETTAEASGGDIIYTLGN